MINTMIVLPSRIAVKTKIVHLYHSGAMHITFGTFATKFVAFFGSIVLVRLLDKNEYGLMGYVENIYSYAFIFAGFGLSYAVLRYLIVAENVEEKKTFFSYIVKKDVFLNLIIVLVIVIFGLIMPIPESFIKARYLIPITAFLLPFQDLFNIDLFAIRSFFFNRLYAWLAFISSTILIIGRIIGAHFWRVEGVFITRIVINAFFSIACLWYVQRRFFGGIQKTSIEKDKIKEVDSYGIQYMIANGLWAVFMLNDAYMLGQLLNDPAALADYKAAVAFPGSISIFSTAIGVFVGPHFTKNEKNRNWIRRNFRKVFMGNAMVMGLAALVFAFFTKPLVLHVYGEAYLNIVSLMRVLLLAAFINSGLRYTCANLLASMGEVKYNMIVSCIGIVIQLVLDIIFIPRIGTMAVGISNCVVFAFMSIVLFAVFVRKFYL